MLILASGSPRRKELIELLDMPFKIVIPEGEETADGSLTPAEFCVVLAKQKAHEVLALCPDHIIIAADTIVVCDDIIYGKPKDYSQAADMLKTLSGRVHSVFTGVSIKSGQNDISFYEESLVEFYLLSKDEIDYYIKSGEPFDKAGGYGIQGKGALLIKKIIGDYFNVMGLPIARVYRALLNIKN